MKNRTIGKNISDLRREKGITQEEMAEKLGVSPQAVSKWENDISCPDILLLPEISRMFGITVDELLSSEPKKEVELVPEGQRKNTDDLILKVNVNSSAGDKVRINLPMPLIKIAVETGLIVSIVKNDALKDIDFKQIITMVEKGLIGKLVDVETADGDIVEIVVE